MLSEQQYRYHLQHVYQPTRYEEFGPQDDRFPPGVKYSHISWTRTYYAYCAISILLAKDPARPLKILDIGFYPGNLIRILKSLCGDQLECYGVGLKIDADFQEMMRPFMKECEYLDFDVFYRRNAEPVRARFADHSFDVVIAAEILEHLISPLEMIETGSRLLHPGGTFIMTTPNVSHIGAVVRLMLGKSNYERLHRSPMYLPRDEWRGHIRFYDKAELLELFGKYALKLVHHRYYTEAGWDHVIRTLGQKLVYQIRKLFWLIPIYREGHFVIFRKVV